MIIKITEDYEEKLTLFIYEHILHKEYYIAFIPDTFGEISLLIKDSFYLCIENNKIVGCIGAGISDEQKVVRLLGPIIDKEYFDKYIDVLYASCLQSLPKGIIEIKAAFYEENSLCKRWCERCGFDLYNAEITMILNKELFREKEIPSSIVLKPYGPEYKKMLGRVHPEGTFFTLDELIGSVCAHHHLILAIVREEVVGYVYYEQTQDSAEGEISLLHVREDKRNSGYGTVLLSKALKELIDDKTRQISINVRAANIDAKRLYERMGFSEKDTIYAYRKKINS